MIEDMVDRGPHRGPGAFRNATGGTDDPGFLTPHWYRVKPFALERADQFRPAPPPKAGSPELAKEVEACLAANGALTLERSSS